MKSDKNIAELYITYYLMASNSSKEAADKMMYDVLMRWFNNDKDKVNCFISTQFNRIGKELSMGMHDDWIKELTPIVLKRIKESCK